MSSQKRLQHLIATLLAFAGSASAQIVGSSGGGSLSGIVVGAVDAITFASISSVPDVFSFLAVIAFFYFILSFVLSEVWGVIDSGIDNATNQNRSPLQRALMGSEDEKPSGVGPLSLVIGFITANGVFMFVGLTGAIVIATLGTLLIVVKILGMFRSEDDDEDGGTSGRSGSQEDGGGNNAVDEQASTWTDVANSVDQLAQTADDFGGDKDWAYQAVQAFNSSSGTPPDVMIQEVNENVSKWKRDIRSINESMNTEDEIKQLNSMEERSEIIHEELEALLEQAENDNPGDAFTPADSDLKNAWDSIKGTDKDPGKQLEKLSSQVHRALQNEEEGDSEFKDVVDHFLPRIKEVMMVSHFFKSMARPPKQVVNDQRMLALLEREFQNQGKNLDSLDRLRAVIEDFDNHNMASDYNELIEEIIELLEYDFRLEKKEIKEIKKLLSETGESGSSSEQIVAEIENSHMSKYSGPSSAVNDFESTLKEWARRIESLDQDLEQMGKDAGMLRSYESNLVKKLKKAKGRLRV